MDPSRLTLTDNGFSIAVAVRRVRDDAGHSHGIFLSGVSSVSQSVYRVVDGTDARKTTGETGLACLEAPGPRLRSVEAAKVVGDRAVAPLRVGVLPLGQVVFGPAQRGPAPGGVPPAGVRAGLDEGSHRRQGARTDGVVQRGAVRV